MGRNQKEPRGAAETDVQKRGPEGKVEETRCCGQDMDGGIHQCHRTTGHVTRGKKSSTAKKKNRHA